MTKIMLIAISCIIFFGAQLLFVSKSEAGLGDPWYACYVVSGGSIVKCRGPFKNKYECGAERYKLPVGAKFRGCKQ